MTHIVRAFPLGVASWSVAILIAAGCAEVPGRSCPPCPDCPRCPAPEKPAEARYEPAAFASIPGWRDAALLPGLRAFLTGCARIAPPSPLLRACEAARGSASDEESARSFLESAFSPYAVASPEGASEGLLTGYYEPILAGSRSRTERYRFPVYGPPDDLVVVDLESVNPELKNLRLRGRLEGRRLVPYWSRSEIEARGLGQRAPVLAWVEDAVELFFMQIQGSGQIELPTGERMRLGYADQNGHPYRTLGRTLVERGELALEQASMQGIKAWAAANPGKLREALNVNSSYVFFRELAPAEGPIGALGAALSAGYSLAVDPRAVPLGAPVFIATTWPLSSQPLERLMAAQDTGGAIRGAVRADVYWGTGREAGELAGRMRQKGRMWVFWPRGEAPQRP